MKIFSVVLTSVIIGTILGVIVSLCYTCVVNEKWYIYVTVCCFWTFILMQLTVNRSLMRAIVMIVEKMKSQQF